MIVKTVLICLCVSAACVAGDAFDMFGEDAAATKRRLKDRGSETSTARQPGESHKQWLERVMFDGNDNDAAARSHQRRFWRARDRHIREQDGKFSTFWHARDRRVREQAGKFSN